MSKNLENGGATVTKDERRINHWVSGETSDGFKFYAKVFDVGSAYGIDGGRVSKLDILKDGKTLVNYDRGWDVEPRTPEVGAVYKRIMAALNALDKVTEVDKPIDLLAKIEGNKQKVSHDAPKNTENARGDELC